MDVKENLVDLIQQGELTKAKSELNTNLLLKVADAFDARKKEIAQGMFKNNEEQWLHSLK